MEVPAKALAQADAVLEEVIGDLKRQIGKNRRSVQVLRQAQMNLRGITVAHIPARPKEGRSDDNRDSDA